VYRISLRRYRDVSCQSQVSSIGLSGYPYGKFIYHRVYTRSIIATATREMAMPTVMALPTTAIRTATIPTTRPVMVSSTMAAPRREPQTLTAMGRRTSSMPTTTVTASTMMLNPRSGPARTTPTAMVTGSMTVARRHRSTATHPARQSTPTATKRLTRWIPIVMATASTIATKETAT